VVVSDVGGFSEIVNDGVNGVKAIPNDAESLAASIIRVLADPAYAENLRANAAKIVQDQYSWNQIAVLTKIIYEEVLEAYRKGSWRMPQRRSWRATGA
ncbi:MAG TPA: glycosyltransferase, partial [Candidatus Acidoferrales bacterium]|nr:glycosyltransferase [Candidatus Acidoferrales bacterium]